MVMMVQMMFKFVADNICKSGSPRPGRTFFTHPEFDTPFFTFPSPELKLERDIQLWTNLPELSHRLIKILLIREDYKRCNSTEGDLHLE
jgi:hypothetical protein